MNIAIHTSGTVGMTVGRFASTAMPQAEITQPGDLLIGETPMRLDDVVATTHALPASKDKWEWA